MRYRFLIAPALFCFSFFPQGTAKAISYSDMSYSVKLMEASAQDTFIKEIPLVHIPSQTFKELPERMKNEIISTVYYEATRSGLDPHLILALVAVESDFRKYAISSVGARGFMQIMPFWLKTIGYDAEQYNLFDMKTNMRFGCLILRHYLEIEKGNMHNALARYNGSLGSSKYPNLVFAKQREIKIIAAQE